uniref:Zinc finger, CCHC-type n=1 Tax=Tanacetum cinerariifolium TaxID=118510 RepID=A0A6L2LA83_TANCI|nr:hypothetical protein [Tanacetum cinerariifolium]
MDTNEKLIPNNGQAVSQLKYSRVIGCLMYAMTCTRPNIAFAVGKLSRYTSNPVLEGYIDARWISNSEDNSSTSGWVFLLCGTTVNTNIKVIMLSIHSDDGNPSRVNIKQHCGRGSNTLSQKLCQGDSLNLPDHSSEKIEEVMADIQTKTTMEEFTTNDNANYYSRIACIMVNGKRAYELKGNFLDDLRDNAFSGTNGEGAVKHIEYFLKIVDPINFPNVNYERLRLSVFPISLVGNESERFDGIKGSITSWVDLTEKLFGKYYPPSRTGRITVTKAITDPSNSTNDHEGVADEEFSNAEETNHDDEQDTAEIFRIETNLFDYETPLCTEFKEFNFLLKIDQELFTHDIERTKTYKDYETELNDEFEEPWFEDGVPYEICDHICEPFRFKNWKAIWSTCNSNENGFCNIGELPGMVWVGYMTYFQDYECYNELAY